MAGARDPFLDGLRAVSVVRVILLHLLQRVEHPFSANFSYFMPGMPLMFFVSGALAAKSLARDDVATRLRFWRERARRLFPPFWAFGLVVLGVCAAGAIRWQDPAHASAFLEALRRRRGRAAGVAVEHNRRAKGFPECRSPDLSAAG